MALLDAMQAGFGSRIDDRTDSHSCNCNNSKGTWLRLSVLWKEDHSGVPPHYDDLSCSSYRPLLKPSSLATSVTRDPRPDGGAGCQPVGAARRCLGGLRKSAQAYVSSAVYLGTHYRVQYLLAAIEKPRGCSKYLQCARLHPDTNNQPPRSAHSFQKQQRIIEWMAA